MAAKQESRDLSGTGIDNLRARLRERLKGDASVGAAVDGVLKSLADSWLDHGAISPDSYKQLQNELGPHLEPLLTLPSTDAKAAADRLVEAYARIRGKLKWA